ncbi:MAG TPA: class I SAM-dependent methyltransferase [Bryobacteraceae bacterium]|nr:class I SAM-dependent methyltransferase [Bryobacteraceae bacterium]
MNADPIASAYRWLEYAAFGAALEQARFEFVPLAADARRILILGEGDGRFLARLLECNRHASIAVIESSARMIELASKRVPAADRARIKFYHLDAAAAACPLPDGPFDLAVTHFFFDILEQGEAEAVIAKVNALLGPEACWLLSEFQIPAAGLRRLHARLWLWSMYRFFQMTTGLRASELSPYRDLLAGCGWTETEHRERKLNFIRSQVWRRCRCS